MRGVTQRRQYSTKRFPEIVADPLAHFFGHALAIKVNQRKSGFAFVIGYVFLVAGNDPGIAVQLVLGDDIDLVGQIFFQRTERDRLD